MKFSSVEYAKAAAEALKDLNMFAAVQALCEHSLFSSASFAGESVIVRICRREQSKCLARYDRALRDVARASQQVTVGVR